jgi:hypothetical protein
MKTLFVAVLLLAGNFLQSQIQAQVQSKAVSAPVSTAAPVKAAFKANGTYVGGVPVPPRSAYQPIFTGAVFNEGKYFLLSNGGEFVVPADGIYHFDVRVSWLQFSGPGKVTINLHRSFSDIVATSVQISSATDLLILISAQR